MSKIIKCMFFVLLAAVLPLSVHAQQVTLHLQDVTVRKAFRELEVKGNVSLVYEKNDVDLTRKVTVKVDNQPISKALDQILKGQELIYKIKDNHIIITRPVVQKSDKKRRINGVISDVNDELLIGVSVSIPGTNIGTVSNMEGKFELEIPEDAKKLQVSYIGFDTQEISLSPGKTTFNIVMGENVKMLSEVVVVGYGTQKKVNLTGSVATVNLEKESLSRPLVSASQALSGMTAGLQVMQSSGTPYNEGFSFNIRGVGTLNSSSPLVLVDGMEQSLNNVDPNDIASISILKDAASCAIYGNRGANGVILVTTKTGQTGKVSVSYNATFSLNQPTKLIKMVSNYAKYMELMNEAATNIGESAPFSDITINQWREAEKDPNGISASGYPNYVAYPNTDWYDEIYSNDWMMKHSLSVTGQEGRTGYNLSISYTDNPGLIKDTGYQRYFLRANVYSDITKWLRIGTRVWGYHTDQKKSDTGSLTNINTQKMIPGVYPYYDGKYGAPEANEEDPQSHNPLWDMAQSEGHIKNTQFFTTFYANVKFLKHFSYDVNLNYKDYRYESMSVNTDYGKYSFSTDQWIAAPKDPADLYTRMAYVRENHWKLTHLLNYNQTFYKHDIGMLLGFEEERFVKRTTDTAKLGLIDSSVGDSSSATTPSSIGGTGEEFTSRSYFGRINYAFDSRYLFEVNMRYDGSSRFAPDNRWGLFPSFSAGWRISEERFMKGLPIDNLKLRASWGKLGNNAIGNYEWQAVYNSAKYAFGGSLNNGLAITSISNNLLEWESTAITNIGIDFATLRNRLTFEAEFYNKVTDGILYRPDMYMSLGTASGPRQNIAEVTNRGIEMTLNWQDRIGKVEYRVSGNFAYNQNKVSKYKGELQRGWVTDENGNRVYQTNIGDVSTGGSTRVIEGKMINEYYMLQPYKGNGNGFNADGTVNINGGPRDGMIRTVDDMKWLNAMVGAGYKFYPRQNVSKSGIWYGDYIYADLNGDGVYGNDADNEFQGCSNVPKYNFGLQASANWKGFDFSMNWSGAAGFKIYYYRLALNSSATIKGYAIGEAIANDHYFFDPKNPNDPRTNLSSKNPRLTNNSGNDQSGMTQSSVHLQKGDYIKLKNLTIGYTLPAVLSKKVYAQNIRFFASGENLFTITGYEGMDPEMRTAVGYSTMRQYAFGVNITF